MPLEQPRKPVGGAYGIFLSKHRPEFTAATKGQKASAISKMAGEKWKLLSEADKAPYEKEYATAKAKYEADMKAFLEGGGEKKLGTRALATQKRKLKEGDAGGKGKRRKVEKDPNRPKKPAGGAFGVFLNKNRKEFQKECPGSITGVSKVASAKWKALSDAAKKPYEEEATRLMAAYKEAMKTYKPPAGAAGDGAGSEEGGDDDAEEDEEEAAEQ
mmetsp:Transcript_152436/g.370035  ORF Transcript_152436/g.370035 Transcript_152436/m.370035 type:complete len:215 (-) Transcript_152436:408-1052(-)